MRSACLALLLLAAGAAGAGAAGINLSWDNCYPASDATWSKSFSCADSVPGSGDANTKLFRLYGSVRTGIVIAGVIAWGARVEIGGPQPVLADWWRLGAGECREGAVTFAWNGFTNSSPCNRYLMTAMPSPVGVATWTSGSPEPSRALLQLAAVRFTGTTVLDTVRYQLFRVDLDTHDTRVDAATGTTTACAGCLDPMCILLTDVELDVPITPANGDGKTWFAIADARNWVSWQADLQLSDCAVAARRTTWGQLKSLYR